MKDRTTLLHETTIAPTTYSPEDKNLIELRLVDKSYFSKNPKHGSYRREPSKAERKRYNCEWVDVLSVSPGGEARIKYYRPGDQAEADGDSKMARAWANAMLEKMTGGSR